MFKIKGLTRAYLSVAFLTEAGFGLIEDLVAKHADKLVFLIGIRNGITTVQGMQKVFGAVGDRLYAVDTGSGGEIFHPKLFLFCGAGHGRLLIGSANLTLGGLNNNIEASALISLSGESEEDEALVDGLIDLLDSAIEEYPANIIQINSADDLQTMLDSGRLADESLARAPTPRTSSDGVPSKDPVPRMKLKVPKVYKSNSALGFPKPSNGTASKAQGSKPLVDKSYEIMWATDDLTRRDLQIPVNPKTKRTGSINLDQGELDEDVDYQQYFRHEVFKLFDWVTNNAGVQETSADFNLIIKHIDYGTHSLVIAHTPSTTSAAFDQDNAMTRLRWGVIRPYIAREDLLGRSLRMYRDKETGRRFILEID